MGPNRRRTEMASKKHRPEEALAKLRQVDALVSQDDGGKRGLSGEPPVSRGTHPHLGVLRRRMLISVPGAAAVGAEGGVSSASGSVGDGASGIEKSPGR